MMKVLSMKHTLRLLVLLFIVVSCDRSYEVFSNKYPVSFSCYINTTPFNKMQSPGHFLIVRPTPLRDGYKVKEPDGAEQTIPYTEVQSRIFNFGLAGLIIGKPYFGDDEYYAYDLGCPHCDRASSTLSVSFDGFATCKKCSNTYDLNNSGVPQKGDSRPLYRYRATLNGAMLMVHN